jgi:hypothetical protein
MIVHNNTQTILAALVLILFKPNVTEVRRKLWNKPASARIDPG